MDISMNNYEVSSDSSEEEIKNKYIKIGEGTYSDVYFNGLDVYKDLTKTQANREYDIELIDTNILREISTMSLLKNNIFTAKYDMVVLTNKYKGYHMKKYHTDMFKIFTSINPKYFKQIIYKIVHSLASAHYNFVIHRDVKPANILIIDNKGESDEVEIALADWGLSRFCYSENCLNIRENIQTLWYRAPEVLLKMKITDFKMDVWSVGIIFLDLINKKQGLLGKRTSDEQIRKLIDYFGYPHDWIESHEILDSLKIEKPKEVLKFNFKIFSNLICQEGLDLIKNMLVFDPKKRFNIFQALYHPYFGNYHVLNKYISPLDHEFDTDNLKEMSYFKHLQNNFKTYKTYARLGSFNRYEFTTKMIYGIAIDKMSYVEMNAIQKIFDYFINNKNNINIYDNEVIYLLCYYLVAKLYNDYKFRLIDAMMVFSYRKPLDKIILAEIEIEIFKIFNLNFYIKTPALYLAILRNNFGELDIFKYSEYFILVSLYLYQTIEYSDEEIIGTILYISKSLAKDKYPDIPKFIVNFDYLEQIVNIHNENILKLNNVNNKLQYKDIEISYPLHFL